MKSTKKKQAKSRKATLPESRVLILRTCDADLKSHGGFQWPASGHVEAKDFKKTYACGNGLHGLLWGEGGGGYLNWNPDAKWLVVSAIESEVLHGKGGLKDKCKFPRGDVVYCGDRQGALAYLIQNGAVGRVIVGGTATAGYSGTATAGYSGTATAGDRGTATAGDRGTVVVRWWDGNRYRLTVGYPGENGIKPNTKYRANEAGQLIEVD